MIELRAGQAGEGCCYSPDFYPALFLFHFQTKKPSSARQIALLDYLTYLLDLQQARFIYLFIYFSL